MSYAAIDEVLSQWAASHELHLATTYRDVEVRSIEIVDDGGGRFQLWVDPPAVNGLIGVHVWDYRKQRAKYEARLVDLPSCLDEALRTISLWSAL